MKRKQHVQTENLAPKGWQSCKREQIAPRRNLPKFAELVQALKRLPLEEALERHMPYDEWRRVASGISGYARRKGLKVVTAYDSKEGVGRLALVPETGIESSAHAN